jgi:hypothetical protein
MSVYDVRGIHFHNTFPMVTGIILPAICCADAGDVDLDSVLDRIFGPAEFLPWSAAGRRLGLPLHLGL